LTNSWTGSADHDKTADCLGTLRRNAVTVERDEMRATVLRYRPEPYFGTHVKLHVDNVRAGQGSCPT
jgi:hypothetical protein